MGEYGCFCILHVNFYFCFLGMVSNCLCDKEVAQEAMKGYERASLLDEGNIGYYMKYYMTIGSTMGI